MAQRITRIKREKKVAPRLKYEFQSKIAKLLLFSENISKMVGFVMICKLYIRIRIRKEVEI